MCRKTKEKKLQTVNSHEEPLVKTTKTEGFLSKPLIHALTIIFVVLLIYSNTFNAPFQLDDFINIVDNPAIKDFQYFSQPSMLENTNIHNSLKFIFKTRYIGYLTFAVNYTLHGLDERGYHLFNTLIHIVNSLLVYWLIIITFEALYFLSNPSKNTSFPLSSRNFIALSAALLFAVHPIQTQAVTYIVQRFASLATLFYLLALTTYIKFRLISLQVPILAGQHHRFVTSAKGYAFYTVSLMSVILAMKTKEFALTLPVVMVIYELMFFEGTLKKRLLYLVPFILTMLVIPLSLTGTSGTLSEIGGIDEAAAKASGAQASISRWDYLNTQFRVIVTYIRLLFLPINQNLDYDYPVYPSFFTPEVIISFLFFLSIFLLGVYLWQFSRRIKTEGRYWSKLTSFGILWFFVTLSAESSIIPIRDVIFEHRVYLPSVGFFIVLTSTIRLVASSLRHRTTHTERPPFFVTFLLVIVLSAFTYSRNSIWKDTVSLWEDVAKKSPNKARPHDMLGKTYAVQGRISDAIHQFKTAVELDPEYAEAHCNLGVTYKNLGLTGEAISEYKKAIEIQIDCAEARFNLATSYAQLGRIEEAIKEYKTVLMITPNSLKTHNNLGIAFAEQGRIAEAISEYNTVLTLDPYYAETHNNLGNAYAKQGRTDEAIEEYKTALKINPDSAQARQNLNFILKK